MLTIEEKERIKALVIEFIDSLDESDLLMLSGKTETDTFTGKGKMNMVVVADKKLN